MAFQHIQNVLNGGEISPLLRARIDQPRYNTGAREMNNVVCMPQGGCTRRPGTRFLGAALNARSRLFPFVFSSTQGRVLEFGDKQMRVWLPNGQMVASGDSPLVVETPYAAADLQELRYAQSADVIYFAHPRYAPRKLSRYSDDTWRWDELTFKPVISAPAQPKAEIVEGDYKGEQGTQTYIYAVTAVDAATGEESGLSPSVAVTSKALNSVTLYIRLTWPPVTGAAYYRIYKKKFGSWGYIGQSPALADQPPQFKTIAVDGVEWTPIKAPVTCVDNENRLFTAGKKTATAFRNGNQVLLWGVRSTHGNEYNYGWRLVTNPVFDSSGNVETDLEMYWSDGVSLRYYSSLGQSKARPIGGYDGHVVTDVYRMWTDEIPFEDRNIAPDIEDAPPEYRNPFEDGQDYPAHVFFHQQRLGFAASVGHPQTIWLSRVGQFENMSAATPPKADDAIEATLATKDANRIVWLQPDRQALAFGTEGSEWTLSAAEGVALTPQSLSFEMQTTNGGQGNVAAQSVGGGVLYLQRGGQVLRQFAYNYTADKYLGQDLTILARHILADVDVKAWAYQQEPQSIIWGVMSDGSMRGLTYMPEQEVIGWHQHHTDGLFKDVVSIPGVPDDQVWVIVERQGQTFIERLDPFFDSDDLSEAFFLDSALHYDGEPVQELSGLTHLAGREVQVFADGGTVYGLTVGADGSLTLPYPASSVHVGLPYTSRLIPNLPEVAGAQGSSLMHNRKIAHVRLRVYRSMSFMAGMGTLYPVIDRAMMPDGTFSIPPFFSEGVDLEVEPGDGWSTGIPLKIEVSSATPMTILAISSIVDLAPYTGTGTGSGLSGNKGGMSWA